MIPFERARDGFSISTDPGRLDVGVIHGFLVGSYWARGIPREVVEKSIRGSLCFGVFDGDRQVGFSRVVTDCATFAYIADVFVLESHRGLGLAKWMMECVMTHPELQGLRVWRLTTRDAHGLYSQFGFGPPRRPQNHMEILDVDIYTRGHEEALG